MKTRSILTILLATGLCIGGADAKGLKNKQKSIDTDSNGAVSLEEFLATRAVKAKAAFKKADANNDGKLDHAEIASIKQHGQKTDKTGAKNTGKPHGKKGAKNADKKHGKHKN